MLDIESFQCICFSTNHQIFSTPLQTEFVQISILPTRKQFAVAMKTKTCTKSFMLRCCSLRKHPGTTQRGTKKLLPGSLVRMTFKESQKKPAVILSRMFRPENYLTCPRFAFPLQVGLRLSSAGEPMIYWIRDSLVLIFSWCLLFQYFKNLISNKSSKWCTSTVPQKISIGFSVMEVPLFWFLKNTPFAGNSP